MDVHEVVWRFFSKNKKKRGVFEVTRLSCELQIWLENSLIFANRIIKN